jgi:hypothetical protein
VTSTDTPDLSFFLLSESASALTVPVSSCGQRYFNAQRCRDMRLADYAAYFARAAEANTAGIGDECLYLKDWHFTRDWPTGYKAYDTPEYFKSGNQCDLVQRKRLIMHFHMYDASFFTFKMCGRSFTRATKLLLVF